MTVVDGAVAVADAAPTVSVSGDAFIFNGGRLEGGTVTTVEDPERQAEIAADGHFAFDGFGAGDQVTFALDIEGYHPIQTATFTIGDEGMERVTFQAVPDAIFDALGALLEVEPDPAKCQIVTTVTRVGKSLYDEGAHGEAGATVTIDPPTGNEGPIYFSEEVLPDRTLTETTEDGGVLFLQVPPGVYTLTASKAGVTFRPVTMTCRAGWLINASPPWGLQAL
ncbi:MAG TPA: hypothetical protein VFG83_09660 [Kofleriaceae bacterium]|nr:hypothetical protein [Kofleriaceae bacterium]